MSFGQIASQMRELEITRDNIERCKDLLFDIERSMNYFGVQIVKNGGYRPMRELLDEVNIIQNSLEKSL